MSTSTTQISAWENGHGLRLTKPMAMTAGMAVGSRVWVTVELGRIVIDTQVEPTLDHMLAAFDLRSMAVRRWLTDRSAKRRLPMASSKSALGLLWSNGTSVAYDRNGSVGHVQPKPKLPSEFGWGQAQGRIPL